MRSIKLSAFLIALMFMFGFAIGCNAESSKTNVTPIENAADKNGSAQDKGTEKSGATDDVEESAEKVTDGKTDDQSSENVTSEALKESGESAQDNPCQPIVDEANKQEQAGIKVDEEQLHKDLNECVNRNASVMSEVLSDEAENASKSTSSGDDGAVYADPPVEGCPDCWTPRCPFVNLDKIRCVPESTPVTATLDAER